MKKYLILIILCLSAQVWAVEDYYVFTSAHQKQQFEQLTANFRCLVCQNQSIADSNAGLASDLREQIYGQIKQGKSDQAIVDFLVARYGEYILYRPPFKGSTLLLWLLPFGLLVAGLVYLLIYIRRERDVC